LIDMEVEPFLLSSVLAGVLAASLAVSSWAARRSRQYTMEQLHMLLSMPSSTARHRCLPWV
jgi:hypothetical protein